MPNETHVAPPQRPRSLAVHGDAADVRVWSNIPHFFYKTAHAAGFLTHALNVKDPDYSRHRFLWRVGMALRLRNPLAYHWSEASIRRMWERIPPEMRQGEIISHSQVFPLPHLAQKSGTTMSYFVDTTMKLLFETSGEADNLSESYRSEILARERELYRNARFLIPMARATARSMIDDYGTDPRKVFVVRAGANIEESAVREFLAQHPRPSWRMGTPFSSDNPAILGFVANDWKRKGLKRLVGTAENLEKRGRPVRVQIIGNCPPAFQSHRLVEHLGWINKQTDTQRFLSAVSGFAMGCLLSRAEPLGISTLECLRLGVPVIGTAIGGIPDCVPPDAGVLVPVNATHEAIADAIDAAVFDPDRYAGLCAGALSHSDEVTWAETVRRMMDVWAGRGSSMEIAAKGSAAT